MPDAAQFLDGFGFIRNSQFKGYILTDATSTHESIKRYHEYKYSIRLTFTNHGMGNYNDLILLIMSMISKQPIIYGIKNPYRCVIDPLKYGDILADEDGNITFNLIGHSYRA